MRPLGVAQRIRQLHEDGEEHARAHPEQALRRALTEFIHGCALLGYGGEGASAVIEAYRTVLAHWDDPAQRRTGSELEKASFACVTALREPLAEQAEDPRRHATRDDEIAGPVLSRVPPRTLVGRDGAYFPMACFNAAGSCLDGVVTPYHATSLIAAVGHYDPPEERDLLDAMRALRVRYEDEPDARPAIADEITRRLRTWLLTSVPGPA
ncbi:hypothetical protein [Actinokineospora iranica]|uniref:Uncharacterized protein n=1 Tax=Actinokineospora iranica TaxID=1271860 RepID=A0A1G6R0D1_9PSEU|nr:hypothetical protein [Actinokineospora iranica]SDC97366.1 hypothetical protein SAMN05216174_10639 [Actinokineospora iranica]